MSARKAYDQDLERLNNTLIEMARLSQDALADTIHMLSSGNTTPASTITEYHSQITQLGRDVEHQCMILLLRQQPIATDLRKISTALKVVADISRIGDFAVDITDILSAMNSAYLRDHALHNRVLEMAQHASSMVIDSITAFSTLDLDLGKDVIARDDQVDHEFASMKDILSSYIAAGPDAVNIALDYLMIAKYFERLGDHAVNIAEWVCFCVTGVYKSSRIV